MSMEICSFAVIASGLHGSRIQRQREIKRHQKEQPIVVLSKKEVEEKRLVDCVLRDDDSGETTTFATWWKDVEEDDIVEVQYPHDRHGLAGKVSNHSKQVVMSEFLDFVDANSQPNGRQAGSYSAQFFFLPKFTRVATPRAGEKNYEEKSKSSVVAEFNRVQREKEQQTCGSTAAVEWLKKHRPKVAFHPSMTDYCDTCKYLKEQLSRNQAILNRQQQSGSTSEAELRALESAKRNLEEDLKQHKETATKAREYYKAATEKCKSQWSVIKRLTNVSRPSRSEREELHSAQHCFTLTISADYQQSKLIPSWGKSEQPGSTYYLQKVSHDILGIVDHSNDESTVYLFDERIGPKNTDHTVSFLTDFWHTVSQQHPWINRLAIFLDNATSTNKNKFLFSWAMEMVSNGELDHIHISFMIAGHTKFAPDRLFSTIGCAYKTEDVFTIGDLKSICDKSATCHIETGEKVLTWRKTLGEKYLDLPGVRKYHDFLKAHDGTVVMKVREHCYSGSWKDSPLRIRDSSVSGVPTETYKDTQSRSLTTEKMANMVTMYDRFIPPHCQPDYLPLQSTANCSSCAPTSASAQSSASPSRKRKQSKCCTEGCDGTGHKNPARWAAGHTTKAGCPLQEK